ncbi:D-aminoacyl-tRNA deacylase [Flammeovirga kamogawensis]|uniref:D-aminoacyl-tRNA deacylase n=1 Tax=Flammeovirga kamogawensis TaxID=373891 RepID=A0ABX8GS18_9BACT|nr:D-aminoacyl-tRNA deacylase [Flammeovirga kamogawensis]MBB6462664.1 D-tyrosyl-tRNA(Tyr) deacylase [Flammeovirga kamogawensis]QWG06098.1 D-tyrosyl-tRNA(Tyr) deacylase [Flammeovirga kamogawensis]TRX67930.1 D-tyrosyl-tRNA(Tyr) deacylase [Flammeovirga kamogawensis]
MNAVIQRVTSAKVEIDNIVHGQIQNGLMVLLGVAKDDTESDVQWLAKKIVGIRIFSDDEGKMNKALSDIDGNILLISQFTLQASTKKGNRPSYLNAADPSIAVPLYKNMIDELQKLIGKKIETGEFGADMQVSLLNDGPVTIIIDTKDKK